LHYLWKRNVAERYSVSTRTVDRWKKDGRLPRPTRMPNGREAWTDEQLETNERNAVGGEAVA
jgi:predicted site-specific integrase-resolvase